MKKAAVAVIAVVVVAAAVVAVVHLHGGRRAEVYAHCLPERTFFYVSVEGLGEAGTRCPVFDVLRDIRKLGFGEDIRRILEAARTAEADPAELDAALEGLVMLKELAAELDLDGLLGDQAVVAVFDNGLEQLPSLVAAVRPAPGSSKPLEQAVDKMIRGAVSSGKATLEEWEQQGIAVRTLVIGELDGLVDGFAPSFAFPPGQVLFSTSREGMSELAAGLGGLEAGSLAGSERFRDVVGKMPAEGEVLSYMDFNRMASLARDFIGGPGRTLLEKYGPGEFDAREAGVVLRYVDGYLSLIGGLGTTATRTAYLRDGIRQESYLLMEDPARKGVIGGFLGTRPGRLRSDEFVPASVIGYQAFLGADRGMKNGYRLGRAFLDDEPVHGQQTLAGLDALQETLGLDIEKDLLPLVGSEMAMVSLSMAGAMMMSPGQYAFMVEVTDEVGTRTVLEKMARTLAEEEDNRVGFTSEDYEGVDITCAVLPGQLVLFQPCYAVTGEFFILSTDRSTLQQMIDCRDGKSESIRSNEKVRGLARYMKEPATSIVFTDTRRQIDEGVALIGWLVTLQRMLLPAPGEGSADTSEMAAGLDLMEKMAAALKLLRALDADVTRGVFDGKGYRTVRFIAVLDEVQDEAPDEPPDEVREETPQDIPE